MRTKNNSQGFSMIEYAVLIILVAAALLASQFYIQRGIQYKYRESADVLGQGEQYERGVTVPTNLDGTTFDFQDSALYGNVTIIPSNLTCDSVLAYVADLQALVSRLTGVSGDLNSTADSQNQTLNQSLSRAPVDILTAYAQDLRRLENVTGDALDQVQAYKQRLEQDQPGFRSIITTLESWKARLLADTPIPMTQAEIRALKNNLQGYYNADNTIVTNLNNFITGPLTDENTYFSTRAQTLLSRAGELRGQAAQLRLEGEPEQAQSLEFAADDCELEAAQINERTLPDLREARQILNTDKQNLNNLMLNNLDGQITRLQNWENHPNLVSVGGINSIINELDNVQIDRRVSLVGEDNLGFSQDTGVYPSINTLSQSENLLQTQASTVEEQRDSLSAQLAEQDSSDVIGDGASGSATGSQGARDAALEYQNTINEFRTRYPTCFSGT